jgi:hypothetical protein
MVANAISAHGATCAAPRRQLSSANLRMRGFQCTEAGEAGSRWRSCTTGRRRRGADRRFNRTPGRSRPCGCSTPTAISPAASAERVRGSRRGDRRRRRAAPRTLEPRHRGEAHPRRLRPARPARPADARPRGLRGPRRRTAGRGDLLGPDDGTEERLLGLQPQWEVLEPARLLVLDHNLRPAHRRVPGARLGPRRPRARARAADRHRARAQPPAARRGSPAPAPLAPRRPPWPRLLRRHRPVASAHAGAARPPRRRPPPDRLARAAQPARARARPPRPGRRWILATSRRSRRWPSRARTAPERLSAGSRAAAR